VTLSRLAEALFQLLHSEATVRVGKGVSELGEVVFVELPQILESDGFMRVDWDDLEFLVHGASLSNCGVPHRRLGDAPLLPEFSVALRHLMGTRLR
jgi:hypothetical protein